MTARWTVAGGVFFGHVEYVVLCDPPLDWRLVLGELVDEVPQKK